MKTLNLTLRIIMLTLALVSTNTTAFAYDFVVKGIYYNINGNEAIVTYKSYYSYHVNDCVGNVSIPETVTYNGNTYTVTAIGDYAFYNSYDQYIITSITLPNTITSIGSCAFYRCSGLTNITIPNSVTNIGKPVGGIKRAHT